MAFSKKYSKNHSHRFSKTLAFVKKHIDANASILDLGIENPMSQILRNSGFDITNTTGEDLDHEYTLIENMNTDVVTAFEIFEHLLNPFGLLLRLNASKLVATVPLKLWFSNAYRSKTDPLDKHYHEFEDFQFDWLLEKTGWRIIDREKWVSPAKITGIRPLLRNFTPRHYAVYAERK